jgi:hypothetical protein
MPTVCTYRPNRSKKRTFSDCDIIRIYHEHLNMDEKTFVLAYFSALNTVAWVTNILDLLKGGNYKMIDVQLVDPFFDFVSPVKKNVILRGVIKRLMRIKRFRTFALTIILAIVYKIYGTITTLQLEAVKCSRRVREHIDKQVDGFKAIFDNKL